MVIGTNVLARYGAPSERVAALDLHTRITLWMVKRGIRTWKAAVPGAEHILAPSSWGEPSERELPFRVNGRPHRIPTEDEDWPGSDLQRRTILALLRSGLVFPVRDADERWVVPEEARDTFQEILPLGTYVARPYHHWDEMRSDAAMSRLAFAGLGAWRLRPHVPAPGDPEGASWEIDLSWLEAYEVRAGFERYGARALFGPDHRPLAIRRGGAWSRPGEPGWAHAKWAWRCSLLVGGTIADHLVGTHWVIANLFTTASRTRLPPTHWLRLLLKPFTWRTVTINAGATETLCPERGLLHRASALTYPSLVTAFEDAARAVRYRPVPVMAVEAGASGLGDACPWWTDAVALHEVLHAFVDDFVGQYAADDHAVRGDADLAAFWQALQGGRIGLPVELSRQALVDVLAWFAWTVTGLHEAVGNVIEVILDPTFAATKIRPGREEGDVQSSLQAMIVVALTGLEMPQLTQLGEAERVFGADRRGRGAFARLQQALAALSARMDAANARRAADPVRPWPFRAFDPRNLETSVSI
jgi:hypothetical protein